MDDLALLPDGSLYQLGDDGLWHHVPDVDTANALGVDWNALPTYDQLPGPTGDDLASVNGTTPAQPTPPPPVATPVETQPTPAMQSPNSANGPLALLPDGSIYVLGSDQLWHHIPDVATANAMGIDWNSLPSYDQLPGPVGDELPSAAVATPSPPSPPAPTATPVATQPTSTSQPPPSASPAQLALLPDGSVYSLGADGLWHHIPDVATANAMGIDWNALPAYDQLPGPSGAALASVVPAPAGPQLPPPLPGQNGAQPGTGEATPGDWTTADVHPVQPSTTGTPIPDDDGAGIEYVPILPPPEPPNRAAGPAPIIIPQPPPPSRSTSSQGVTFVVASAFTVDGGFVRIHVDAAQPLALSSGTVTIKVDGQVVKRNLALNAAGQAALIIPVKIGQTINVTVSSGSVSLSPGRDDTSPEEPPDWTGGFGIPYVTIPGYSTPGGGPGYTSVSATLIDTGSGLRWQTADH